MCPVRGGARPLLFDRAADVAHGCARREHLLRVARDVEAHRAVETVRLPFDDIARVVAARHEAVLVALVAGPLASTEAGHVAQNLGMLGGEDIRGADDIWRPRRGVRLEGQRRQLRLLVRLERLRGNCLSRIRHGDGVCGRLDRVGLAAGACVGERADDRHDDDQCRREQRRGRSLAARWRLGR